MQAFLIVFGKNSYKSDLKIHNLGVIQAMG